MKPETAGKVKYGVWGLILGAVVAMIIGFALGGWTTAATTQKISEEAVVASKAAICAAQFKADPGFKDNLDAFEKKSSYQRSGIIEEGGWDKMPGEEESSGYDVKNECVTLLEELL